MVLFNFTDSINSAPGHSELLWYPRNSPAAVQPKRCHDNRGTFHPTRKQRKTSEEGQSQRENVEQRNTTDIIKHRPLASVETLTFPTVTFLLLPLHDDCVSVFAFLSCEISLNSFLWLQYFNSICYFRKPKWSLSFVSVDGGLSTRTLWLC